MSDTHAVSIVGAGDMGHGFAVQFSTRGEQVVLTDHKQSNLDAAESRIEETVRFLNELGWTRASPSSVLTDIEFVLDRTEAVSEADLVLETIPEQLDLKQELFAEIIDDTPGDALLASNTSGIPIGDIAAEFPSEAHRMVGCHWWFPPYLLRPVEVVRSDETSERSLDRMCEFLGSVDRDPIMVQKDVPGFVWNRVQHAVIRECLHLVDEGVASVDDVNRAIRDGYATRTAAIGPFETMDVAGLDLVETVAADLSPHLCDRDEPSPLFDELVEEGRGGIDDGAGFFEYDAPADQITRRRDKQVVAVRNALEQARSDD
jgi:3-hydroxyacyl-CoA dehydrogenase